MLLVGFSEELLTRGLAIVRGRGSMHEKWVRVFSGATFSLLHLPNAYFGQSASSTVQQVVFAFAVGLTYYVTRRLTGTLIVTMGLHTVWDFSVFIQDHSGFYQSEVHQPVSACPAGVSSSARRPCSTV